MTIKHSAIQVLVASVVIAVCICLNSFGQEKLTKEEKKAKRAAEYLAAKEVNLAIVESRQWVLESETVQDREGQSYIMNPSLNFAMIDGDQSTIQLDFGALIGWNGVGGITFDGTISKALDY